MFYCRGKAFPRLHNARPVLTDRTTALAPTGGAILWSTVPSETGFKRCCPQNAANGKQKLESMLGDSAALGRDGRAADDSELLVRAGLFWPWLPSTTAGAACNDGDETPVRALAELLTCKDESVVKPALADICSAEDDDVIVLVFRE